MATTKPAHNLFTENLMYTAHKNGHIQGATMVICENEYIGYTQDIIFLSAHAFSRKLIPWSFFSQAATTTLESDFQTGLKCLYNKTQ